MNKIKKQNITLHAGDVSMENGSVFDVVTFDNQKAKFENLKYGIKWFLFGMLHCNNDRTDLLSCTLFVKDFKNSFIFIIFCFFSNFS